MTATIVLYDRVTIILSDRVTMTQQTLVIEMRKVIYQSWLELMTSSM